MRSFFSVFLQFQPFVHFRTHIFSISTCTHQNNTATTWGTSLCFVFFFKVVFFLMGHLGGKYSQRLSTLTEVKTALQKNSLTKEDKIKENATIYMRYFSAVLFNCCDCLNCIYFIVHLCCLSRIVSSLSARITFSVSLIFLVVSCIVLNIEHTFSKYYKVLKNYCSFVDKYSTSWNTHIYECMHSYMLTKSFCL